MQHETAVVDRFRVPVHVRVEVDPPGRAELCPLQWFLHHVGIEVTGGDGVGAVVQTELRD